MGWIADGTQFVVNLVAGDDAADSTILLVGASGPPRKLRDRGQAISISPDGWWIAFATAGRQYEYRNIWLLSRDGKTERKLFDADPGSSIAGLAWSPDGRRVAYVRVNEAGTAIETRDLYGQASTIFRAVDPDVLQGVAWLPDGRLLYSLRPASNGMRAGTLSCTHWQMRLDNAGQPLGSSTPMAGWLPNCVGLLSVSANGKRAAYLQWAFQDVIRLGDLNQDGTRITASSRLTLTQGANIPSGWTSDVKSLIFVSDGSGRKALVRQDVDAETPQPIVEEPGILGAAWLTPEGASLLYVAAPRPLMGSRHRRLMQVPITGGASREILTGNFVDGGARCAVLPATLCAIAELSADGGQIVFTSIDVLAGRGRELARMNIGGKGEYRWALSPDGARIAVLDVWRPRIDVLSLTGMPPIDFEVKGHSKLGYVSWTADGNRLLVPSVDARGAALLSVDLGGNSHVLWQQPGALDISGVAFAATAVAWRSGSEDSAEISGSLRAFEDAPRPF